MSVLDKIDNDPLTSSYFDDMEWSPEFDYTTSTFIEMAYYRAFNVIDFPHKRKIKTNYFIHVTFHRGWLTIMHDTIFCQTVQDLEDGIVLLLNKHDCELYNKNEFVR